MITFSEELINKHHNLHIYDCNNLACIDIYDCEQNELNFSKEELQTFIKYLQCLETVLT